MDGNLKRLRIVEDVRCRIKLRECNSGVRTVEAQRERWKRQIPKTQPIGSIFGEPIAPVVSQPNGSIGSNGTVGLQQDPHGSQHPLGEMTSGGDQIGPLLAGPTNTGLPGSSGIVTDSTWNVIFGTQIECAQPLNGSSRLKNAIVRTTRLVTNRLPIATT